VAETTIPALFLGDMTDPWVAGIAGALPPGSRAESCDGTLPRAWPEGIPFAHCLVIHRDALSPADREGLVALKAACGTPPRVVLCHGPHARRHQLESWVTLVDALLPEATAGEVIAHHVAPPPAAVVDDRERPTITVVGEQHEWRSVLAAIVRRAGFPVEEQRDWPPRPADLVVWDAPLLDQTWAEALERRTQGRRVLAVLDFADRALVRAARSAGAAACLDSTADPDDFAYVLARLAEAPPLPTRWRLRADGPTVTPSRRARARPVVRRTLKRHATRSD
jgi:hypothetical protein